MSKYFLILLILFSSVDAEDKYPKKSVFAGQLLSIVTPFGGLGYAYADQWKKEYGYKWLLIEGTVFTSAAGMMVYSHYIAGQNASDLFFLFEDNYYGYTSIVLAAFWLGFNIYEQFQVAKLIKIYNNGFNIELKF